MLRKIDGCTYDLGNRYRAERMQDGTWEAYRLISEVDGRLAGCSWSSPRHSSLRSARSAASANRRLARHLGSE